MKAQPVDWVALYFLLFGVWPLADPGHGLGTPLSALDMMIHVAAACILGSRWKMRVMRR